MGKSKVGTKDERSPDGLSPPNQYTIIISIIWQYFIKDEKNTMKLK